MKDSAKPSRAEWLVTLPSFVWLMLFFAIPALIVLAFTFHGHTANGGVGEWIEFTSKNGQKTFTGMPRCEQMRSKTSKSIFMLSRRMML